MRSGIFPCPWIDSQKSNGREFVNNNICLLRDLLFDFLKEDDMSVCSRTTDTQWGLFSSKSQTFGLGLTIWADKYWGIWCIFGQLGKSISVLFFQKWIETIMTNQQQIQNIGIPCKLQVNRFGILSNIFLAWV